MGTKQLIILFVICFLVAGCTRETVVSPHEKAEGKVPVSLRIFFDDNMSTRSTWEYDEFFPEIRPQERKVSNIMLIVFKNTIFEQYSYYGIDDFDQDPNDYSIFLEDEEGEDLLELEPGPHFFYTILNMPDDARTEIEATLSGQEGILTKDNFERIIVKRSLEYMTGDENHFIMTNSTPPALQGIYSQEQIENNNELSNEIQIKVGRAVGKISFAYVASEVQTGQLHGSLTNIRYKILHNPPSMYLMPVVENDILLTPHYNSKSIAGSFKPSTTDQDILAGNWLPATTKQSLNNGDDLAYGYCIENNNKSPLRTTSIMLLIEAKFNPVRWLNKDGTQGQPSSDGTFYRIGCYNNAGVLFAYEQGYYNDIPSNEVMAQYVGNAVSNYAITKYKDGITYYGCWPKSGDQYMVKRNSYYKIAITHIHGAGEPDPGGVVDPDVDPEDPTTYGRLAVYALSWNEENIEVSVGEDPYREETNDMNTSTEEWQKNKQEEELKSGSVWE